MSDIERQTQTTAPAPASRLKNAVIQAVKIVVAALIIYYLVHKGTLNFSVFEKITNPSSLAILFGFVFLNVVINNVRWHFLVRGQGLLASQWELMKLTFIGLFFNYAMPGGVGGDVVKGVYLVKEHPEHKYAAAMSIFMDRIVGFFVMVLTASIALCLNLDKLHQFPTLQPIALAIWGLTFGFAIFFAFSLSLRIRQSHFIEYFFKRIPLGDKFRQVYLSLHAYRKAPMALLAAILISFVSQFFGIYFFSLIGGYLGITLDLSVYFFIVPAGMVVTALPISPAGVGVGQFAFMYLFNLVLGGNSSFGATAFTFTQVVQLCWSLIGVIFYLQRKGGNASQRTRVRDEAPQVQ